MSTDLTARTAHALPLEQHQITLLKDTICKGASDAELHMFIQAAERLGLDPFSKQIYSVPRWDKKEGRHVRSIQVGIDGFRLVAQRSGRYAGQEGTWWCGPDGVWKEIWTSNQNPVAAKTVVLVVVNGVQVRCPAVAHWGEYADNNSSFWKGKPALMLAKCSEALALRKAFPAELSGYYTPEEMTQAGVGPVAQPPAEPPRDQRDSVRALRDAARAHGLKPPQVDGYLDDANVPRAASLRERIALADDVTITGVVAQIEADARVVDAEVVDESAAFAAEQAALDNGGMA